MARWTQTVVTTSAGQVAGTSPILAAVPGLGDRKLLSFTNRSAAAVELFLASGGIAGQGVPVAAGATLQFHGAYPGFDGELYILGGTAGDKMVLLTA